MKRDDLRQIDVHIRELMEQTLQLSTEQMRPRPSLIGKPWFPWVAMPCAVALGASVALLAR